MKCKLPNLLLSLIKSSQDISEATCKWIPLPPLNKQWNDEEIYKYFQLSEDEIKIRFGNICHETIFQEGTDYSGYIVCDV